MTNKYAVKIYGCNPRNNETLFCDTKAEAIQTAKNYCGDIEIHIVKNGEIVASKNGEESRLHWV